MIYECEGYFEHSSVSNGVVEGIIGALQAGPTSFQVIVNGLEE